LKETLSSHTTDLQATTVHGASRSIHPKDRCQPNSHHGGR
jgi:hypothetical protein